MIINKSRFISYITSIVFVLIFLSIAPLNQPLKYISFILINFFLITSSPRLTKFFSKKFFLSLSFLFILFYFVVINLPLQFKFEIKSISEKNISSLTDRSKAYYYENYSMCKDTDCHGDKEYEIEINDTHFRNYININNIHELRANMFYSPGSTLHIKNWPINKDNYSYEIIFEFPKIFFNSNFCYEDFSNESVCEKIKKNKSIFTIIGKGEKIKINLIQNIPLVFIKILILVLFSTLLYIILKEIVNFRVREKFELLYPFSIIFWLYVFSLTNNNNVNFINAYFYQYPGGDGHWYLILATIMSENLKNFNFLEFFRGGVDIYYFMPGMRYFVALEKYLFGNSYYFHLIIFSFLPFLIRNLLKIYLSKKITYILLFSFLFFPIMHHMGFSLYQYIRYSSKVFAEPIAYTMFLFGFIRLVYYFQNKELYANTLPLTCLVICLSCFLRPNLAPSSFFLLIIPYLETLFKRKYKIIFLFSLSGSFIFLPLIHNLYFGGQLILFTSAVFTDANIKITLVDYFKFLTSFDLASEKKTMIIEIIKNFFNPFEIHKYFILLGVLLAFKLKYLKKTFLTPLYIVIISQFILFLFLNPGPRYTWIFWLVSLVLSMYIFTNKINKK